MSVLQPVVPMLSLPSVVLFPHSLLDLKLSTEHITYATGEWLAEGALWGIATLRGDAKDPQLGSERGSVFRTVGIGCIIHRERSEGAVRRLVLEGLVRGRILDGCETADVPALQVEILRDHVNVEGAHRKDLAQVFADMVRTARQVAASQPDLRDPIRRILAAHPHPGVVADLLAHRCVADTYAKQSILAELDVCRRIRLVQVQLACMVTRQSLLPLRRFR
jgi:Lon protease-like protein